MRELTSGYMAYNSAITHHSYGVGILAVCSFTCNIRIPDLVAHTHDPSRGT